MTTDLLLRPVVVGDAYVVSHGGRTYLDSGRGVRSAPEHFYSLYERVAPALDGSTSLGELIEPLGAEQAAVVVAVVQRLLAEGLVRDTRGSGWDAVGAAGRARFADEIAFLEACLDRPEEAFARFRASPVLLVGAEPLLTAGLDAAVRMGVREVWVWVPEATRAPSLQAGWQARVARSPGWEPGANRVLVVCDGSALPDRPAVAVELGSPLPRRWADLMPQVTVRFTGEVARVYLDDTAQAAGRCGASAVPTILGEMLHGPAVEVLATRMMFAWLCQLSGLFSSGRSADEPAVSLDLVSLEPTDQQPLVDRRSPVGGPGDGARPGWSSP